MHRPAAETGRPGVEGLGMLVVAGICLLLALPLAVKALAEAVEIADLGRRGVRADATVIGVEDRSMIAPPLSMCVGCARAAVRRRRRPASSPADAR